MQEFHCASRRLFFIKLQEGLSEAVLGLRINENGLNSPEGREELIESVLELLIFQNHILTWLNVDSDHPGAFDSIQGLMAQALIMGWGSLAVLSRRETFVIIPTILRILSAGINHYKACQLIRLSPSRGSGWQGGEEDSLGDTRDSGERTELVAFLDLARGLGRLTSFRK